MEGIVTMTTLEKYYTLVIKLNGKWREEFGNFNHETVKEVHDIFNHNYHRDDLKIITTLATKKSINRRIERMNHE